MQVDGENGVRASAHRGGVPWRRPTREGGDHVRSRHHRPQPAQEVDLDPDELEPDLADLPLESDAADVVEQRLAVGYDDGREAAGPAL